MHMSCMKIMQNQNLERNPQNSAEYSHIYTEACKGCMLSLALIVQTAKEPIVD